MDKKEIEEAIKAAVAPLEAKFTAAIGDLAVANAKITVLESEKKKGEELAAAGKVKMHRDALTGKLEAAVKDKRLTPAQRESTIKFMRLADDKAVLEVSEAQIDEYISVNGAKIKLSAEQGKGGGTGGKEDEGEEYEDAGDEVYRRAQKLRGEDAKLSFAAARDRVMDADPKLAKKYLLRDEAA